MTYFKNQFISSSFYFSYFLSIGLIISYLNYFNYSGYMIIWEMMENKGLSMEIPILMDNYSMFFIFTVSIIYSRVLIFSEWYMQSEKYLIRFNMILSLFVFSMFMLILIPNMFGMFLGWDGLGISSYFLVIYFQKEESMNAGMLTMFSNRVGDLFFMGVLSVMLMENSYLWFMMSENFFSLNENLYMNCMLNHEFVFFFSPMYLSFMGAITKSAQIPFSAWLPAAMAAPTPVSALVHSSTLVTAGVYTLFRLSMFQLSNNESYPSSLTFLSAMTMLMAGISAMGEMDAKKIVALSTLSQLGLMMLSLSIGNYEVVFIHLNCHAYFKALLFISVGSMISLTGGYQDLRKFSLFSSAMPLSVTSSFLSSLSLCGFFFLAGFYSKDLCIESMFFYSENMLFNYTNMFVCVAYYLGVILTAMYTARFIFFISCGYLKSSSLKNMEKDPYIFFSMIMLVIVSIVGGSLCMWLHFEPVKFYFYLPPMLKSFPLIMAFMGFILSWLIMLGGHSFLVKSLYFQKQVFMWNLPNVSSPMMVFLNNNLGNNVVISLEKGYFKEMFFSWSIFKKSKSMFFTESNKMYWSFSLLYALIFMLVVFFF